MFTVEVRFSSTQETIEKVSDAVYGLLGAWSRNGQTLDDTLPVERQDCVLVYVDTPEENSLDDSFANGFVRKSLEGLKELGALPEYRVIGPVIESATVCDCKGETPLVLFTNFMARGSPLRLPGLFPPYSALPHSPDGRRWVWERASMASQL